MSTNLELYNYDLPDELIAQYPIQKRDDSRLLVVDRASGALSDHIFSEILNYLHEGDVLVMNDSRVVPARLFGTKQGSSAAIELFLLEELKGLEALEEHKEAVHNCDEGLLWKALARPARRLKTGDCVNAGDELFAQVISKQEDGSLLVSLSCEGDFSQVLARVGTVPLPPYIKRAAEALDSERYQTVYAQDPGSAAAPTAGLHFTNELLEALHNKGVQMEFVTLHVGLGTFRPVQAQDISEHHMHKELYHINEATARTVAEAKAQGRRVICVGTTSVRTLESAAFFNDKGELSLSAGWGSTDLFIYPGARPFHLVDGLITNFHLPKSSLLMLVAAFAGRENILAAYQHAIQSCYRFFSYGDAMLIV